MSNSFQDLFKDSEILARSLGHQYTTIDHLAVTVLSVPSINSALSTMGIDSLQLSERIIGFLKNLYMEPMPLSIAASVKDGQNPLTVTISRVMAELTKKSVIEQLKSDDYVIEPYFVLFECLSFPNTALEAALQELDISNTEVARSLQKYVESIDPTIALNNVFDQPKPGDKTMNSPLATKQKGVDDFTTNLTELARNGQLEPMIGRAAEVQSLIETLSRKNKQNAVLTGEAGVGKTQIVEGLAQHIADGNVPEHIKNLEILSLNMGAFTGGTKYRGEFEERVDNFLKEIKKRENTIVFIDELHTIMGAGSSSSNSMDMSNLIKPALSRGEIRVIGATTYDEYSKHIEKDGALARRFMKIDVIEPTVSETLEIINGIKHKYEKYHNVVYDVSAIDAIMELSEKFLKTKRYPDKAIDLLDASAAKKRAQTNNDGVVTRSDIENVVSTIANLDINVIACTESTRMTNLPTVLRERVFGQDEAINKLVDNVMVARAGLRDSSSVQGAFMFIGPSGTGKTEISKALADATGVKLIRFDMSEFAQEHTVAKLIGSPPGYVGHDSGNGQLLDAIEKNPSCVLLLDEIEKADRKVLLTFLQVLDEGRLTGSKGKTVYFNNVTVIMTSNIGVRDSTVRSIGASGGVDGQEKALKAFLPPEFLNRIDAVVKFNELSSKAIDSVIDKYLDALNETLSSRNIVVNVTEAVHEWLAKNGVQAGMGARPMKRLIEQTIRLPLAKEMLTGELQHGGVAVFDLIDNEVKMKPILVEAVA